MVPNGQCQRITFRPKPNTHVNDTSLVGTRKCAVWLQLNLKLFNWDWFLHFQAIQAISSHLAKHDLSPLYLTFDLIYSWRYPCCISEFRFGCNLSKKWMMHKVRSKLILRHMFHYNAYCCLWPLNFYLMNIMKVFMLHLWPMCGGNCFLHQRSSYEQYKKCAVSLTHTKDIASHMVFPDAVYLIFIGFLIHKGQCS